MSEENDTPEPPEPPDGGTRKMDPELRVMAAMVRQLDALDEPAKGRVVRWLEARYADELSGQQ